MLDSRAQSHPRKSSRGFSLVELVIVIVIIGVIAAIAVPRISRGASGAAAAALQADLQLLRKANSHYAVEHDGVYPRVGTYEEQLTLYSDINGNTNATKTGTFVFGPYLVSVPKLGVGEGAANGRGESKVGSGANASVGWIYDESTGDISANSGTATDTAAVLLSTK